MAALGIVPSRPEEKISLGAPGLLQFSVSHAALHFGVEAPLNRRNQKSGATKRKQEDIERERLELLMQTAAE